MAEGGCPSSFKKDKISSNLACSPSSSDSDGLSEAGVSGFGWKGGVVGCCCSMRMGVAEGWGKNMSAGELGEVPCGVGGRDIGVLAQESRWPKSNGKDNIAINGEMYKK